MRTCAKSSCKFHWVCQRSACACWSTLSSCVIPSSVCSLDAFIHLCIEAKLLKYVLKGAAIFHALQLNRGKETYFPPGVNNEACCNCSLSHKNVSCLYEAYQANCNTQASFICLFLLSGLWSSSHLWPNHKSLHQPQTLNDKTGTFFIVMPGRWGMFSNYRMVLHLRVVKLL